MARRNVEWCNLHTNSVALREMAQSKVEKHSVRTNGVALHWIALQNIRRFSWTLNCLALCEIFQCCGEWSSLLLAWREGYFADLVLLLFQWTLSRTTTNKWNIGREKRGQTYRKVTALLYGKANWRLFNTATTPCDRFASIFIFDDVMPSSRSLHYLWFVSLVVSSR